MSQYGKAEYWDERYSRYPKLYSEILSHSIGISASAASKTSSLPTSIRIIKCSMWAQGTQGSAKKWWKKDTLTSLILTTAASLSRPWLKSTNKKPIPWSTYRWTPVPWNSMKAPLMLFLIKPALTQFLYISFYPLVRRKFNCQCWQDDFWDLSHIEAKWSIHHCFIWATRIQA